MVAELLQLLLVTWKTQGLWEQCFEYTWRCSKISAKSNEHLNWHHKTYSYILSLF